MNGTIIGVIIGSVASSSVIVELIRWWKESRCNNKINRAICELLYDRVLHLCTKYLDNGTVPYLHLKSCLSLYSRYVELNCNKDVEDELAELVERVKELPIK